jgi:2,5-diamino-6-(ribosylamino)-4(3H)-pyrimidinone 5'-phosphate reductase
MDTNRSSVIPTVTLHVGVSLDGRLDWGAGEPGPYYALVERLEHDADLSGSNTMLAAGMPEDPQSAFPDLYAAFAGRPHRPLLVVVDSQGRVKNWRTIQRQPYWRGFVSLCSRATPESHLAYLRAEGIETIIAGEERVDLRQALAELHERCGVQAVRVDSGGILNGVLLRAGLVSEVSVLIAPCLVGGISPKTMYVADDLTAQDGVVNLELKHVETVGEKYVWVRYRVLS